MNGSVPPAVADGAFRGQKPHPYRRWYRLAANLSSDPGYAKCAFLCILCILCKILHFTHSVQSVHNITICAFWYFNFRKSALISRV